MDVVSHFDMKRPLFRIDSADDLFRSQAFETAGAELIAAANACESPLVLTGPAGVGKTMLLGDIGRRLKASGGRVCSIANPAFSASIQQQPGIMLVDETDTADGARIADIVEFANRRRMVIVLAALHAQSVPIAARVVRLGPMAGKQAYDFILAAAAHSGRADLFSAAALDAIVDAAHGIPRALKRIANGAVIEAMFKGGHRVEVRHVVGVIAALPPLAPPEADYGMDPRAEAAVTGRTPVEILDSPEPIVLAALPRAEEPEADDDVAGIFVPPPPAAETRRRWRDARGTIAGAGALGLLLVAAGVYAVDRVGFGRIAGVLSPAAAPDDSPKPAPHAAAAVDAPDGTPAPLPAEVEPEPAGTTALAAMPADDAVVASPPMPAPGMPGYRPPQPPQPTIAAAVRAGIATNTADEARRTSALPPPEPLSLGVTSPLVDDAAAPPGIVEP